MLRLVDDKPEAKPAEKSDAEIMAEALPHLRRLAHCEGIPEPSRLAAHLLARLIERRQGRGRVA